MKEPIVIVGEPAYKPRMTKRDVWMKRPSVLKYRAWADSARITVTGDASKKLNDPDILGFYAIFYMPISEAWAQSRKEIAYGALHKGKPDTDNMLKAVADALFEYDSSLAIMVGVKKFIEIGKISSVHLYLLRKNDVDNFGVQGMINIPPSSSVNGNM